MTKPPLDTHAEPLPIGSTIGILGGGQLARMLAMAAAKIGMNVHIYCPEKDSPACEVANAQTIADYEDGKALDEFATSVDIATYEFENVPAKTAQRIQKLTPLAPNQRALSISQDRLLEKNFLRGLNIEICPFEPVISLVELETALEKIGAPAVLKTTRFGYDGKGQRVIRALQDAKQAFEDLMPHALVLEKFAPFEKEISIIIARTRSGEVAIYDPAENVHKDAILHTSTLPADVSNATANLACDIAKSIAHNLDYVGVLAIEFFVIGTGTTQSLLVNEIAPRVHNSGHWTMDVCPMDQFDAHIRAICNWPLGTTARLADCVMTNIVGDEINHFQKRLQGNCIPHIYGKKQSRPGRKMGHINQVLLNEK